MQANFHPWQMSLETNIKNGSMERKRIELGILMCVLLQFFSGLIVKKSIQKTNNESMQQTKNCDITTKNYNQTERIRSILSSNAATTTKFIVNRNPDSISDYVFFRLNHDIDSKDARGKSSA